MQKKIKAVFLFMFIASCITLKSNAQTNAASSQYFAVEDYYRVKWGYADEFIALWKKNHYPLLKKAQEHGDVISITATTPRLHSGEDTRWDFRVTVVFKTAALAFDENLTAPYKKQLYADQDTFNKEEQHRFELLLSHWDIETADLKLN